MSDNKGATLMLHALPPARELIGDRGYDSDGFRAVLIAKKIPPCIPPRKSCKVRHVYHRELHRKRHKVENIVTKLKDWRRAALRYDCCAQTFLPAIVIAATMLFWINH